MTSAKEIKEDKDYPNIKLKVEIDLTTRNWDNMKLDKEELVSIADHLDITEYCYNGNYKTLRFLKDIAAIIRAKL
jgi:hypothetical protein